MLMRTPLFLTVLAFALVGCASTPQRDGFGQSVRAMQVSQRHTPPDALIRPGGHAPLDPGKAGAILQNYRESATKPDEGNDEIRIRINN